MTQTMREQLQALVNDIIDEIDELDEIPTVDADSLLIKLNAILATPDPAVTVQPGWYCKDGFGFWRFIAEPTFAGAWIGVRRIRIQDSAITDPWPDKPNGGPECVMEVG